MKYGFFAAATLLLASALFALDGDVGMHDPSTVVRDNGKFYSTSDIMRAIQLSKEADLEVFLEKLFTKEIDE